MKEDLLQIARNIAEASEGRVRLAFNEEDATTEHLPDAAHFLKLDGMRLGRDIELYAFMALPAGAAYALASFLEEVFLRLKGVPSTQKAALDGLRALGEKVVESERLAAWRALLDDLQS